MRLFSLAARSAAFSFSVCLLCANTSEAQVQTRTPLRPAAPTAIANPPSFRGASGNTARKNQTLSVYSHGDPTAEEQQVLEMINRARMDPTAEGNRLYSTNDPDVKLAYAQYGTPTPAEVKADFVTYKAKPPLAFNAKLIAAARGHSQDMLDHDYQSHTGSDGSLFGDRLVAAGYVATGWSGENIFAYGKSMWDIHATFEIDFGNPGLGHRLNIMNFNDTIFFREVGLGIIHGGAGSPDVGPIITTEDFGDRGTTFILGVVYDDKNKNGFYDPGEGLSGVTIRPSSGSYTAVTSTSGGYAIPYSGSGTVTVTASGGALTTSVTHSVTFSGENVKVDFQPDKSGLPGIVSLVLPLADTLIHRDTALFQWNKVTGATKYHLQVATDSLMKTLIVNDSSITDTFKVYPGLNDSGVYFWRVAAKNAKGAGDYSMIQKFDVSLPPGQTVLVAPSNGITIKIPDITFMWRSASPRVSTYRFLLSTQQTMINPIINDSTIADTFRVVHTADLPVGHTYYWTVQSQNESGWSGLASVRNFKIDASSVAMTGPLAGAFSVVQPNPMTSETHIRFTLDRTENISLKIFNLLGACVSTITDARLKQDKYDLRWTGTGLTSGVYLYQLRVGDRVDVGRIVLAR